VEMGEGGGLKWMKAEGENGQNQKVKVDKLM